MAALDLSRIKSPEELERIVQSGLEGKTLAQIANQIKASDLVARVNSKASVGHLLEEKYFGIKRNNTNGPDIEHLGVEIKTSPLIRGADGRLRVKEPLSLNIINYKNELLVGDIRKSSFYRKNRRVLLIWYIHNRRSLRSDYLIKYVFLWELTKEVIDELEPDYDLILEKINEGRAHHIHQSDHHYLTLCPKHGGKYADPECKKSKTTQPNSNVPAQVKAFRLKNAYMNEVIRRFLRANRPAELSNFVQVPVKETKKRSLRPVVNRTSKMLIS